jgi:lysophospholipase L1-like esterase
VSASLVSLSLVSLTALLGGCGWGQTDNAADRVTVVGDSLTVLGNAQIRDVLTAQHWKVAVDAFPGRTVTTQMAALLKAAGRNRGSVVIELGTNDAHALANRETTASVERAQIRTALDLFPAEQCLVWVNADADPGRPGGIGGRIFDDALTSEASSRPNVHVADLAGLLAAHREYFVGDKVHLTDGGSTALGQMMAEALRACSGP